MIASFVRSSRDTMAALSITASLALVCGAIAVSRPALAPLLAGAVLLAGLAVRRPVLVAVVALPMLWGLPRVGPLRASDLTLTLAALLALPALTRRPELHALRPLVWAFGVYLASLVPTLVVNPGLDAGLEWLHRISLVVGAALVGAWLVAEDRVTLALRLLVAASSVVALAAVVEAVRSGFDPAYPLDIHKNYAGSLLALVVVLLLCAPRHVALGPALRPAAMVVLSGGALATQSRGALLGAGLGLLLWFFSARGAAQGPGPPRVAGLLVAVVFTVFAGVSVNEQFQAENVETSSVGVRQEVEAYTFGLFQSSPVVGVGIRYFRAPDRDRLAMNSNNAINNELAESGLIGATGFVVLHVTTIVLLFRRRRTTLGIAALSLLTGRLLHGMVDIHWSSGVTPLPWIVTGMALAAGVRAERRPAPDETAHVTA